MMSKSSFLVSVIENNKRRLWVWVLSLLLFVLAMPVGTALMINNVFRNIQWMGNAYSDAAVQQILREKLLDSARAMLGPSFALLMLAAAVALISAVQGFSWLYSRKKIDFYMGMPVKRKKRFLVIWLNGILLYVLPYFLGLVLSIQIAALNGAWDKTVIYCAAVGFVVNLCAYLGVYHMAILAVMLTGNIVITGLAFFVFCIYEYVVRLLTSGYKDMFFRYYSSHGVDDSPVFSPFPKYVEFMDAFNRTNSIQMKPLLHLLLFALVLGALSYICYLKRPAEAAGKALTFEITKPFVKVALTAAASLLAGAIMSDIVNFMPQDSMSGIGWMIFSMALTVLIGSALIQVIYEFDIKGALHKKSHIAVSGIIVAIIFLIYQEDLFGYDDYIPKPEQIESVAFVPEYYEEIVGGAHFDEENRRYVSAIDYADKYMKLTNVEDICELAAGSMEAYNKLPRLWYLDDMSETEQWWSYATLVYHLKNGRQVSRSLWVNVEDERTAQLLDNIIGSREFKEGFWMTASDRVNQILDNERYEITVDYGNLVYDKKLSKTEAREFIEIYQRELEKADFGSLRENVPVGVMKLTISEEIEGSAFLTSGGIRRSVRSWEVGLNVYPFYEESIAYLREQGCYMDIQLKVEDVARIQVINSNTKIARQLLEQQGTASIDQYDPEHLLKLGAENASYDYYSGIDTRVYADYTDEEVLKKIAECVYPENLVDNDWDHGKRLDEDYKVLVYFKTDSEMTRDYGTNAYYGFLEGEIPDFVKEDTVYQIK